MKKHLQKLLFSLALLAGLACGTAAPAQAAGGLPCAKAMQNTFGYTDATRDLIDNVWITLTNYGGPYVCPPAAQRAPAQVPGDAPAEGAVAVMRLYARTDETNSSMNITGHSFLVVENVSDTAQTVGGMTLAPGTCISMGTYGNKREHAGLWFGLESYLHTTEQRPFSDCISIQTSLDAAQLDTLNQNLLRADHWSSLHNCASFVIAMWNAVCADTVEPAQPFCPATLKADIMQRYPDLYAAGLPLRRDYAVVYGTTLTPSVDHL